MALIARLATTGEEVEGFSVPKDEWKAMKQQPIGAFLMCGTDWPAVPKTSSRGLQFFAYAPGYVGFKPEPESYEHSLTKISIVRALREAGFSARVEYRWQNDDGDVWQADAYVELEDKKFAFEVQFSHQTLEVYEERTARYARAGVKCVWLVPLGIRNNYLINAVARRRREEGLPEHTSDGIVACALPHVAQQILIVGERKPPLADDLKVVVFPRLLKRGLTIPLAEWAVGVMRGHLYYEDHRWLWSEGLEKAEGGEAQPALS